MKSKRHLSPRRKKRFPLPLKVDCSRHTADYNFDLADELRKYFVDVELVGGTLFLEIPLNEFFYDEAWKILNRREAKVIF